MRVLGFAAFAAGAIVVSGPPADDVELLPIRYRGNGCPSDSDDSVVVTLSDDAKVRGWVTSC